MKLNFKQFGEGSESLIILHGLFGSLDNWQSIARILGENYEVFIVDARNHGKSPQVSEHTYSVMADDLYEFIRTHSIDEPIVLGHSMGGKTVMEFAASYPQIASKLIVVDIAPKAYKVHHQLILDGMHAIDLSVIKSRSEADEVLKGFIEEYNVRQFLLKNLYWREKGRLAWRFNLEVLSRSIKLISNAVAEKKVVDIPSLFISGGKSNYINVVDHKNIKEQFPLAQIETIASAGHWLHAEATEEFLEIVGDFLS